MKIRIAVLAVWMIFSSQSFSSDVSYMGETIFDPQGGPCVMTMEFRERREMGHMSGICDTLINFN